VRATLDATSSGRPSCYKALTASNRRSDPLRCPESHILSHRALLAVGAGGSIRYECNRASAARLESEPLCYSPRPRAARKRSRLRAAMVSIEISFGHTAAHSPMLVQLPKPNESMVRTIESTRDERSG
jgi:hypothetical protein